MLIGLWLTMGAGLVHAQGTSHTVNFDGVLLNPSNQPITSNAVSFRLEIWDKNATCMLYSEVFNNVDLSTSSGAFSLKIGSGSSPVNRLSGGTSFSNSLFVNSGATGAFTGCSSGVTLNAFDQRLLRVSYDTGGGYVTFTCDFTLGSVPTAMVADSLRGKTPADLLQVNTTSGHNLSQANLESVFTSTNFTKLTELLSGASPAFISANPSASVNFNSQQLINLANPTTAQAAATKSYADTYIAGRTADVSSVGPGIGGGSVLAWDQALNRWVATMPFVPPSFDNGGNSFGANALLGLNDNFSLGFKTNGTEKLRIDVTGKVGIGTIAPVVALDLSAKTDAIRLPRGTTAQRPVSPSNGDMRFNTTIGHFEYYESGTWITLMAAPLAHGAEAFTANGTFTVPAGVTSVKVTAIGGGGGGCNGGGMCSTGAGGLGASGHAFVGGLTTGQTITVTVGTAGTVATVGSAGGNTSFGSFVTANGGTGATTSGSGTAGSFSTSGSSYVEIPGYRTLHMAGGATMMSPGEAGYLLVEW